MNELYQHISTKSPLGIPYSEAVKLMLTLYCTLAILPKEMQKLPLTKEALSEMFSRLATDGKIVPDEGDQAVPSDGARIEHWVDLAMKLFRGQTAPDMSFPARASKYV